MTLHRLQTLGLILLCLTAVGCDQGRENPPDASVRVLNAAPSFGTLEFRRGMQATSQNQPRNIGYKEAIGASYDEDSYGFYVDATSPGAGAPTPVTNFSKEIRSDTDYTIVLTEVGGLIEPVFLEQPRPQTNATQANVIVLHAGEVLAPMDLYLSAPDTPFTAGPPVASLSFGQSTSAQAIAAGEYVLTATVPGDPTRVLLASTRFALAAAASSALVIVDGAEQGVAPFGVILVGQTFGELLDQSTQAALRVINGATDGAPRDVAINEQFAPPLFPAVPFATATDYQLVPPSNLTLNVTPPGNPGVLELTATITPTTNIKHTVLFAGDAGALTHLTVLDDGRRIDTEARVRFYNVASQFTFMEFFVAPPGTTELSNFLPFVTLGSPSASTILSFPPGTYDLFLRPSGSTTLAAGPVSFTVAGGGIYSMLAVNGPDTASAGVVFLDDFP